MDPGVYVVAPVSGETNHNQRGKTMRSKRSKSTEADPIVQRDLAVFAKQPKVELTFEAEPFGPARAEIIRPPRKRRPAAWFFGLSLGLLAVVVIAAGGSGESGSDHVDRMRCQAAYADALAADPTSTASQPECLGLSPEAVTKAYKRALHGPATD
jgi:hypothetical protein